MGARREVTQASLQDTFLRARKRMKILILLSVKFSVIYLIIKCSNFVKLSDFKMCIDRNTTGVANLGACFKLV